MSRSHFTYKCSYFVTLTQSSWVRDDKSMKGDQVYVTFRIFLVTLLYHLYTNNCCTDVLCNTLDCLVTFVFWIFCAYVCKFSISLKHSMLNDGVKY